MVRSKSTEDTAIRHTPFVYLQQQIFNVVVNFLFGLNQYDTLRDLAT
ncbi:hypothetical protein ACO0K2_09840 [Undibacterium sp. MH2W]